MAMTPLTLGEINVLDRDDFVARLGFVFESSPWIAAEAWHARPFRSLDHLHETMCEVMYDAAPGQKLALIRAHPDLVGRAALTGTLSPESKGEQASAGLNRLSAEEVAEFTRLNGLYREKFGFPFVICARENKKESILAGFDARLHNSRKQEIATALAEVAKIARLRLLDIIKANS
jgi:2-oxo-4-hydroxy-4-carboxy-5-ureidoimidazoline decarboxylase